MLDLISRNNTSQLRFFKAPAQNPFGTFGNTGDTLTPRKPENPTDLNQLFHLDVEQTDDDTAKAVAKAEAETKAQLEKIKAETEKKIKQANIKAILFGTAKLDKETEAKLKADIKSAKTLETARAVNEKAAKTLEAEANASPEAKATNAKQNEAVEVVLDTIKSPLGSPDHPETQVENLGKLAEDILSPNAVKEKDVAKLFQTVGAGQELKSALEKAQNKDETESLLYRTVIEANSMDRAEALAFLTKNLKDEAKISSILASHFGEVVENAPELEVTSEATNTAESELSAPAIIDLMRQSFTAEDAESDSHARSAVLSRVDRSRQLIVNSIVDGTVSTPENPVAPITTALVTAEMIKQNLLDTVTQEDGTETTSVREGIKGSLVRERISAQHEAMQNLVVSWNEKLKERLQPLIAILPKDVQDKLANIDYSQNSVSELIGNATDAMDTDTPEYKAALTQIRNNLIREAMTMNGADPARIAEMENLSWDKISISNHKSGLLVLVFHGSETEAQKHIQAVDNTANKLDLQSRPEIEVRVNGATWTAKDQLPIVGVVESNISSIQHELRHQIQRAWDEGITREHALLMARRIAREFVNHNDNSVHLDAVARTLTDSLIELAHSDLSIEAKVNLLAQRAQGAIDLERSASNQPSAQVDVDMAKLDSRAVKGRAEAAMEVIRSHDLRTPKEELAASLQDTPIDEVISLKHLGFVEGQLDIANKEHQATLMLLEYLYQVRSNLRQAWQDLDATQDGGQFKREEVSLATRNFNELMAFILQQQRKLTPAAVVEIIGQIETITAAESNYYAIDISQIHHSESGAPAVTVDFESFAAPGKKLTAAEKNALQIARALAATIRAPRTELLEVSPLAKSHHDDLGDTDYSLELYYDKNYGDDTIVSTFRGPFAPGVRMRNPHPLEPTLSVASLFEAVGVARVPRGKMIRMFSTNKRLMKEVVLPIIFGVRNTRGVHDGVDGAEFLLPLGIGKTKAGREIANRLGFGKERAIDNEVQPLLYLDYRTKLKYLIASFQEGLTKLGLGKETVALINNSLGIPLNEAISPESLNMYSMSQPDEFRNNPELVLYLIEKFKAAKKNSDESANLLRALEALAETTKILDSTGTALELKDTAGTVLVRFDKVDKIYGVSVPRTSSLRIGQMSDSLRQRMCNMLSRNGSSYALPYYDYGPSVRTASNASYRGGPENAFKGGEAKKVFELIANTMMEFDHYHPVPEQGFGIADVIDAIRQVEETNADYLNPNWRETKTTAILRSKKVDGSGKTVDVQAEFHVEHLRAFVNYFLASKYEIASEIGIHAKLDNSMAGRLEIANLGTSTHPKYAVQSMGGHPLLGGNQTYKVFEHGTPEFTRFVNYLNAAGVPLPTFATGNPHANPPTYVPGANSPIPTNARFYYDGKVLKVLEGMGQSISGQIYALGPVMPIKRSYVQKLFGKDGVSATTGVAAVPGLMGSVLDDMETMIKNKQAAIAWNNEFLLRFHTATSMLDYTDRKKQAWEWRKHIDNGIRMAILGLWIAGLVWNPAFLVSSFLFNPTFILYYIVWSFTGSSFINKQIALWGARGGKSYEAMEKLMGQKDMYHQLADPNTPPPSSDMGRFMRARAISNKKAEMQIWQDKLGKDDFHYTNTVQSAITGLLGLLGLAK